MEKYFRVFQKKDNQKESLDNSLVADQEYGSYEKKIEEKKNEVVVNAFRQVWEKKSQQLKDSIEESMDTGKSYKYFAIFLGIGALFLFLSVLFLPTVIFSPHKFALLFSIGSVCMLISMAFYRGPKTYLKKLFRKDQALFSIAYICSLFLTLFSSVIMGSYLLTILA